MMRYGTAERRNRPRGFTLLEAMLATSIVGIGILSMMQLFTACTIQNRQAVNMTAAMLLAQNVQETMAGLAFSDPAFGKTYFGPEPGQTVGSFDDIDDFDDGDGGKGTAAAKIFNPPIDSTRQQIPQMANYAQDVSVWPVYPNQLSSNSNTSAPDMNQLTYTGAARVTVRILHRRDATAAWTEIYRTSWIRVAE
jgi:prepilin-type N-terminal cleavage/methylation domain-containing protein